MDLVRGVFLAAVFVACTSMCVRGDSPSTKPATAPTTTAAKVRPATAPVAPVPHFAVKQIEFFESRIRPLLASNCYECHGEKKQSGGLRLDSREAILLGGDDGPVVSVGKPDESDLIAAMSHANKLKMPPNKKLPDLDQQVMAEWIREEMPWPVEVVKSPKMDLAWNGKPAREHWAFKPPVSSQPPAVREPQLVKTEIDQFVLAKLEEAGLSPAPSLTDGAEQRTKLLRRVTYDLTGLPPTLDEIDAFVKDSGADAFAKVVDRLLESPHYGEYWGRHWLDVARYATDNANAAVYRDWVIRAFNRDMPYDKFLQMQIAADLLIPPAPKVAGKPGKPAPFDEEAAWQFGGMGLLRVGRGGNKQDSIDDQIDVVSRGMMGMTVSCARCHDHKFEPIPTADYYSLYSIFENTSGNELTVVQSSPDFRAGESARRKAAEDFLKPRFEEMKQTALKQYAQVLRLVPQLKFGMTAEEIVAGQSLNPYLMMRWHTFANQNANNFSAFWTAWRDLESIPRDEFAEKAPAMIEANGKTHPLLLAKLKEPPAMKSFDEVADRYASVFEESMRRWDEAKAVDPAIKELADKPWEEIRRAVVGFASISSADAEKMLLGADQSSMQALREEQARFASTYGPRTGLTLREGGKIPATGHVLVRGNPNALGAEVPRRFLAVLAGENRASFPDATSGRLELAQAIGSRDNPLTARVMVNRIWHWHFGSGLVKTPSDFGLRGEKPTHPELLDYLAVKFMDEGWSVKKLQRMILLSSTYQQSSDHREDGDRVDPDNRLWWRANRQRLDLESMRDSLLAASGGIDFTPSRSTINIVGRSRQRSVYAAINRGTLAGLFRVFDLPNPDAHGAQRPFTTVPQQALFFLNGPFVGDCARRFSTQPQLVKISDAAERIRQMYRMALGRLPAKHELEFGLQYIAGEEKLQRESSQFGYGTYAPGDAKVMNFAALSDATESAWDSTAMENEAKRAWVVREGKNAEANQKPPALVRRWKVSVDGTISISGEIKHADSKGSGVRCFVVSSRLGTVANWASTNAQIRTAVGPIDVKAGDVIDFVVVNQSGESEGFDNFSWAPTVRLVDVGGKTSELQIGGSDAWQKYAQALLMSNEFVFVD